jgi:starch synthase
MSPLKIVMISSECAPFAKTGGLADVVGALPTALKKEGHEAIVVMPLYSAVNREKFKLRPSAAPFGVWMGNCQEWCAVWESDAAGFTTYFIEFNKYFDRFGYYHDAQMNDYLDNAERFGFLCLAALQWCRAAGFDPDVVHTHDWQSAPAACYLKDWYSLDPVLGRTAGVLTIHNLSYQGVYSASCMPYLGIGREHFHPDKYESWGKLNLLKAGIFSADLVTTVSPNYARETKTAELGCGLAPYLNRRGDDYRGILNGVDYTQWNPETDPTLPARYTAADLSGKAVCKRALQERFHLEADATIPVVGVVSRFASQKGLDQLAQVIEGLVNDMRVQFVVLGSGDKGLEAFFGDLPRRYPGRIGTWIGYDDPLSHLIEAGSDFFVMPSVFEPCGLNQLYSLRYGTLPIVRATGGLDDTVEQYDEARGTGTGFKYADANPTALYFCVGWAVSTWYDRPKHFAALQQNAMKQDFSWDRSAAAYVELYRRALSKRRGE